MSIAKQFVKQMDMFNTLKKKVPVAPTFRTGNKKQFTIATLSSLGQIDVDETVLEQKDAVALAHWILEIYR